MSQQRPAGSGYQTPARGSHQSGAQSDPGRGQTGTRQADPRFRPGETQYRQGETHYRQGETQYRPGETQYREPTQYRRAEPVRRAPEPPRKRHGLWKYALLGLLGLIALGGILGATISTLGHARHVTHRIPHPRVPAAPGGLARPGTSFLTHDAAGDTYRVRLDRIIDPATGVGSSAAAGNRLVGAVYTVTGVSGAVRGENVVTNASLLDSGGHIYRATGGRISGVGNFSNSNITVARGASQTGAAAYQIPDGTRITQAQWAAAAGHGQISRWAVP